MLASETADTRRRRPQFFQRGSNAKSRAALLDLAKADPDPRVRGRAWESLADAYRRAQPSATRWSQCSKTNRVGPKNAAEQRWDSTRSPIRMTRDSGIEALYQAGGPARAKALEAMWRSLWSPMRGSFRAPYRFRSEESSEKRCAVPAISSSLARRIKIAKYFDAAEPFDHLREDALFAYALAMPGETTRGRIRGMLRKIESITPLTSDEADWSNSPSMSVCAFTACNPCSAPKKKRRAGP